MHGTSIKKASNLFNYMYDHKMFLDTKDRYANAITCIGILFLITGEKIHVLVFLSTGIIFTA
jgi:hypothetical protein